MHIFVLRIAGSRVIIHAEEEIENILRIFMLDEYVDKSMFCYDFENGEKNAEHIFLLRKSLIVSKVEEESKKIFDNGFVIYISNKQDDPKGIIIERTKRSLCKELSRFIVISENLNSQVIFFRSVLFKLFIRYYAKEKFYPLHCSAIKKKNSGYIFLADSLGGKSTLYFTFAAYGSPKKYALLADDTVMCKCTSDSAVVHAMPLKPSLRRGSIEYLGYMKPFQHDFDTEKYKIEDQIYVNPNKISDMKVDLNGFIKYGFFVQYADSFCIEKITDHALVKKRLAIIICGYKATSVDDNMVDFLNSIVKKVMFYQLSVPKNLEDFFSMFESWVEGEGGK